MALDLATAMTQYGYVSELAKTNPEIQAKLNQAVAEEWDSARFDREIRSTQWFQSRTEQQRQIAVQKATDPATYNNTLLQKQNEVYLAANRMGLSGVNAWEVATLALENGWSDNVLQGWLADKYRAATTASGGWTGSAGEIESHIRQTWADYGLTISDATVGTYTTAVLAGRNTLGGVDNEARNYAKAAYPPFAQQLDSGLNMQQIADPYMQTMANTLELSATSVKLSDPAIKRALQGTDGKPLAMWDFERQLKDDARWQETKQAKNETYSVLQQVGKDWGFL